MPSVKDTLQAMEAMADRATLRDLRDVLSALLTLRTHLVLQDRTRADSLMRRLDSLLGHPTGTQSPLPAQPSPELNLLLQCPSDIPVTGYVVRVFDNTGAVASTTTRDTFEASLHLVRRQLGTKRDYHIAGTWKGQLGKLAVSTPRGQMLALIEPRQADPELHGGASLRPPSDREPASAGIAAT